MQQIVKSGMKPNGSLGGPEGQEEGRTSTETVLNADGSWFESGTTAPASWEGYRASLNGICLLM